VVIGTLRVKADPRYGRGILLVQLERAGIHIEYSVAKAYCSPVRSSSYGVKCKATRWSHWPWDESGYLLACCGRIVKSDIENTSFGELNKVLSNFLNREVVDIANISSWPTRSPEKQKRSNWNFWFLQRRAYTKDNYPILNFMIRLVLSLSVQV